MFVRTRYGVHTVYEGKENFVEPNEITIVEKTHYGEEISSIKESYIVDKSDNIEKLADYLVLINPDKTIDLYTYQGDGEWRNESGFGKLTATSVNALYENRSCEFKLAIVTPKALLFVATFIGLVESDKIEMNWELEM